MTRLLVVCLLSLFALVTSASAQTPCSVPNTLTNGTNADATQVMANFNALLNCVNSTSGRKVLTANTTYYVRTDGSDSNNGLSNTPSGAFLTIQKAIDTAVALDLSIFSVTIQVEGGTYSPTNSINLKPYVGGGTIALVGDTATPDNVVIASSSSGFAISASAAGIWGVRGFKITNSGGGLIQSSSGSFLTLGNNDYGACPSGQYQLRAIAGGQITFNSSYTISGGGGTHIRSTEGGAITYNGGLTVTVSGTPAFSVDFAHAENTGLIVFNSGTSYSGSATGNRYTAAGNGVINTSGGGANFFPGSIAGSTSAGGQYL